MRFTAAGWTTAPQYYSKIGMVQLVRWVWVWNGYGYAKPSRSNAVGVVWARNVPKRDGVLEAEKH
jgi:hypothetical protein